MKNAGGTLHALRSADAFKAVSNAGIHLDAVAFTRRRALTSLALLTLWCLRRLARSQRPLSDVARVLDVVQRVALAPRGIDALTAVWSFFMEVTDAEPEALRTLLATRVGGETMEGVMTTADRLREEGRTLGKAEGLASGKADLVMKLMCLKFGALPASVPERVLAATPAELDQWAERILRAETLVQVIEG